MPERFSAYLSIFNDWDLLEMALQSISRKVDEIVVVDGAYEWMYPFLRKLGIDPERSDEKVMEAVHACGVPIKVVTGLWSNEIEKRIAGYKACSHRYIYRIDADEILFFHEDRLRSFINCGAPVARMEMPLYAAPGWIVAGPGDTPTEQQGLLFDREQISPEAHLRYLWLILGKDTLPEVSHELPPEFPSPIAFNAHLTNWRTPATSVNRSSFYTLNYMRHYHTPWAPENERHPITDFENFFESISATEFRDAFLMNDLVIGQVKIKDGAVLRPSPLGDSEDAPLVPFYIRFLDSLADLNVALVRTGRVFTRDMIITIDLSTPRSTDAVVFNRTINLAFTAELTAVTVILRYLIPASPWQVTIEPAFSRTNEKLTIMIPSDEPSPYLRRCLEVQAWSSDTSVLQRLHCIRPPSTHANEVMTDELEIATSKNAAVQNNGPEVFHSLRSASEAPKFGFPRRVTLESTLEWFDAHGEGTDRHQLAEHFDRFAATRDFTLRKCSASGDQRMMILDIGARWLHRAFFFAAEGHALVCSSPNLNPHVPEVQSAAKAMGANLVFNGGLDGAQGITDVRENSIDIVLFGENPGDLACDPLTTWTAIYRVMKPGARIIMSVPNATNLIATRERLESLVRHGQFDIHASEILRADEFRRQRKNYSVAEIKDFFKTLSDDFSVTHWITWGSSPEEASLSLRILIGDADTSPQDMTDPVVGLLRRMVRAGHPVLGSHVFIEVTLLQKLSGINTHPPSGK